MKVTKPADQPLFHAFDNHQDLLTALVSQITSLLQHHIDQHPPGQPQTVLAVSGGRTPQTLFEHLSRADIPWQQVLITLIDERWLDSTDHDSNEKLVRDHLLQNNAAAAHFLPLKNAADTPVAGEQELATQLAILPDQITVSLLGLGNDGHTASFFPGANGLTQALDMNSSKSCQAINTKAANVSTARMTLTLPRILASQQIILYFTGDDKLAVYHQALQPGPVTDLPVRSIVQQQQTPVSVYWTSS